MTRSMTCHCQVGLTAEDTESLVQKVQVGFEITSEDPLVMGLDLR